VDYVSVMRHLKLVPEALILLVLDMSDLQGSICRELPKIIGENKPVILIGILISIICKKNFKPYYRINNHFKNFIHFLIKNSYYFKL
jgi:ribosome biogenesis GTPase A